MRWILRVIVLLLIAALLGIGGWLAWFQSERNDKLAELASASQLAANGVEYTVVGDGPSVLVFHGAPGGYDQGLVLTSSLLDEGFQVIAVSRPGYLRTPLRVGLTPEEQADATAKVLEELRIESVAVLGCSLGAPVALEFARRHPQHVWALVVVGGVTQAMNPPMETPPFPERLNERLTGDIGSWLAAQAAADDPAGVLRWLHGETFSGGDAGAWSDAVAGDPAQRERFAALGATLFPMGPREDGLRNDLLQMRALAAMPFEALTMPTLFVHGTLDLFAPVADVRANEAKLPAGELMEVTDAGHLVEFGPSSATVREAVTAFLRRFSGGHGTP